MYVYIFTEKLNKYNQNEKIVKSFNVSEQLCSTCIVNYFNQNAQSSNLNFPENFVNLISNKKENINNNISKSSYVFKTQDKSNNLLVFNNVKPLLQQELKSIKKINPKVTFKRLKSYKNPLIYTTKISNIPSIAKITHNFDRDIQIHNLIHHNNENNLHMQMPLDDSKIMIFTSMLQQKQ